MVHARAWPALKVHSTMPRLECQLRYARVVIGPGLLMNDLEDWFGGALEWTGIHWGSLG